MHLQSFFAAGLGLVQVCSVLAHGPTLDAAALAKRDAHLARSADAISACSNKLRKRDFIEKRSARTNAFVNNYLSARGLEANFETRLESRATCVLAPEQEEGPYYVEGELIREDLREDQPGIDLLLDVQILDVNTCEPLPDVMVDFWMCNSTGLYSDEQSEKTLGETYLRGLQASDDDGIVQVLTKVPGWYSGRAQHIHVKAHTEYTISGNTTTNFNEPHTGQVFFEQSLLTQINKVAPYTTDKNPFTLNSADRVITEQANKTAGYDAFLDITLTGDDVSDGLVGTITIAIDP